ncbi:Killer toxin subunits alpha/beta [Lachnellula suecica]|uniref:chitinase n=1 Tax=Lachnellula suecica TaxID=602035 RepID=A0A8T9C868_9HELO|nr:Killer toxin subunits alpha/beta [Lachnellula suecica]
MSPITWHTVVGLLVATFVLAGTVASLEDSADAAIVLSILGTATRLSVSALPEPTNQASLLEQARKPLVPAFEFARNICPFKCDEAGHDPGNWTVYHSIERLAWCHQTLLLDFAIHTPLYDPSTHVTIRSCSVSNDVINPQITALRAPELTLHNAQVSLQMATLGTTTQANAGDVTQAAQEIFNYISSSNGSCESTVLFASTGSVTIGFYAGSQIQSQGLAISILQQFIAQAYGSGFPQSSVVQLCGSEDRGIDFMLGIAVNIDASLDFVQKSVSSWSNGECVTANGGETMKLAAWNSVSLWVPTFSNDSFAVDNTIANSTVTSPSLRPLQLNGGDCTTIQVVSQDSCATLAAKCGISGFEFESYNTAIHPSLCSTLSVGEYVCCSKGSLPNLSPKPNSDGSCASYLVVADDSCWALEGKYTLTSNQIENYNKNTWGWNGCGNLQIGVKMCLSQGTPPMPAPIVNAVCGPQVVGSLPPTDSETLANLNLCPLNACCDIWGQCGVTLDFCVPGNSTTNAPGTAAPGQNGCISSCGVTGVKSDPPTQFMKIGYFEGFDQQRPCLNMEVTDINPNANYTHVHLAFAAITTDFNVDTSAIQGQFDLFVQMTGFKKIVSFGGWSFSTDANTFPIFRHGVTEANRANFIANLVTFVKQNNLDGLDFDWEYPGAPDIPGIPAGSPDDGMNYYSFLLGLRKALSPEKTISIAAPASYWYLKGFPIKLMGTILDYVVYMTYDLHGQWDYGNTFSDSGCPHGNCLQSHVNITETIVAIDMLTKAGVPSYKVVVGIASYGRAFQMTTPGCTGPSCTYTGPLSGATPGQCTQTAGYLAGAEIDSIIAQGGITFLDDTLSNILVYNGTQWAAYMDESNKGIRTSTYRTQLNLGGTSEWAIDLASESNGDDLDDSSDDESYDDSSNFTAPCDYTLSFSSLTQFESVSDQYPAYCAEIYALEALLSELAEASANYTDADNGYDGLFGYYVKYIKDMVPLALDKFMIVSEDDSRSMAPATNTSSAP